MKLFISISLGVLFAGSAASGALPDNGVPLLSEKQAYEHFLAKRWKAVAAAGKAAIKNGKDSFWLRKKIGMAYFEMHNYRRASKHMEQAFRMDSYDPEVHEYLYKSYIFSGRELDARRLASSMTAAEREKLSIAPAKALNGTYLEAGSVSGNNSALNGSLNLKGPAGVYGRQEIAGRIDYGIFGFKHFIGSAVSLFHSYTALSAARTMRVQAGSAEITDDYCISQRQYYAAANISLAQGISAVPSLHFINIKYNTVTAAYNGAGGYDYNKVSVSSNDFSCSLAVAKDFSAANIGLFGGFSNISGKNIVQKGMTLAFFPLGNLDIYTVTTLVSQGSGAGDSFIAEQKIGSRLFSSVWAEVFGTSGDITDYAEKNNFIVYNNADKTRERLGASLILPLSGSLKVTFIFENMLKEGSFVTYVFNSTTGAYRPVTGTTYYRDNLIDGGVEWKF